MVNILSRISTHLKHRSQSASSSGNTSPEMQQPPKHVLTQDNMTASPVPTRLPSPTIPSTIEQAKPENGMTREQIEAERQACAVRPSATVADQVHAQAQIGEAQRQTQAAAASLYTHGYVRADTVDEKVRQAAPRLNKRLVLFCDGTWQDGTKTSVNTVTNVLRLARCVLPEDFATYPPTPQIVYYQSGVGTTDMPIANITQGATGAGIVAKIREAYSFVAQNFLPGDEIFLFGFSRGAYTARMIAALIGDLGVLPRTEMENFYTIFKAYQARSSLDPDQRDNAISLLNIVKSKLKLLQDGDEGKWGIRCVGVWDTVGALGIPGANTATDPGYRLLGFRDTMLGPHIAHAFHALAIDEPREDFTPTKWVQTEEGKKKNQVLSQVWFNGCHSDVGGGYTAHDDADLTLAWMMSNLIKYKLLALDVPYFFTIPHPHAAWGKMMPHDPRASGFMAFSLVTKRKLPEKPNSETHEGYHLSTADRDIVKDHIKAYPELLVQLEPLEAQLREWWAERPISKSNDEVAHEGLFSNLLTHVKDLWDGDERDDTAGGNITKAQSRKDALDAIRGAPDTEDAPPPMKPLNPNANAASVNDKINAQHQESNGVISKARHLIGDLVQEVC